MQLYSVSTVKPRYSVFQGISQNYILYRSSFYCQYINNYENTFSVKICMLYWRNYVKSGCALAGFGCS